MEPARSTLNATELVPTGLMEFGSAALRAPCRSLKDTPESANSWLSRGSSWACAELYRKRPAKPANSATKPRPRTSYENRCARDMVNTVVDVRLRARERREGGSDVLALALTLFAREFGTGGLGS